MKDQINPNHYKAHSIEVIEMMERIWGVEKVIAYCELCAFKYRMRAGLKTEDPTTDIQKAKWYEDRAAALYLRSESEDYDQYR